MDVDDIFEEYSNSAAKESKSDENKNIIESKVEKSDIVRSIKFYNNNVESYVFDRGDSFRGIIKTDYDKNIILKFKARHDTRGTKDGFRGFRTYLYLYPEKNKNNNLYYSTDKLFLDAHKYGIDVIDEENEEILLSNLPIKVNFNNKKKIPKKSIFVESRNNNSNFPNGDFLLLNSNNEELKKSGNCVIVNRTVLWHVNRAMLFREGDFKKEVTGDDIWCLVDESNKY